MKNSDQFFRNEECRYFPCHDNSDSETFNCLFCYCPLYLLGDRCGGNFKYVGESKNVKCCSECTFPHEAAHYDLVIAKLKEILEKNLQPSIDKKT
ncbi:MAG: cysteine-rich small domain-containing protein [Planctomycetaceae bacterium]|nr:cysteine-rich small domain-containing protein [Planctomycetaceae bacterium]